MKHPQKKKTQKPNKPLTRQIPSEWTFMAFKGLLDLLHLQLAWLKVTAVEEITVKLYYKNKLLSWILSNKDIINMTTYMILIYWYWFASKLSHKVLVVVVQKHVQNKAWWTLPKDLDICHWIHTWRFSRSIFLVRDTEVHLLFLSTVYIFISNFWLPGFFKLYFLAMHSF